MVNRVILRFAICSSGPKVLNTTMVMQLLHCIVLYFRLLVEQLLSERNKIT